jgi:hypothetical protein
MVDDGGVEVVEWLFLLLVLEVAAVAVGAVSLLEKAEAGLRLVGGVDVLVATQLLGAVRELAPPPVGTKALRGEVLAERTLDLGTALVGKSRQVDGGPQDGGL